MTPLDTLAPDQRAVLELVLRQGRSYGELSELLVIPEHEVRARADAGVRALAGEPAAGVDSGRIADWLLGQQPGGEAERTRDAVARSDDARTWAQAAAERLGDLGGAMPSVPAAPDDRAPAALDERPTAASDERPTARDERPIAARDESPAATAPRSSRLGGAILIALVAVVVAAGLLWIFVLRDDEDPAATAPPAATETPTAAGATENDIVLQGTGDSQAQGLMRLVRRENGTVQFAIAAQNVPPNRGREVYAVWFTREGGEPRRLGFAQTPVGQDGILTTGGPQQGDEDEFPRWFATYDKVLITRETNARARQPGPVVLEGTLPAG